MVCRQYLAAMSVLAAIVLTLATPGAAASDEPVVWHLYAWDTPFDYKSKPHKVDYRPLVRAAKSWRICAAYPHLKDSYWVSVNYGMVEQARSAGVQLTVVEAGGYPNLERQ